MSDSNADQGGHGILTTEEIFEVSSNVGTALTIKGAFGENQQAFLDGLQRRRARDDRHPVGRRIAAASLHGGGKRPLVRALLTQMSIGYEVTQTRSKS